MLMGSAGNQQIFELAFGIGNMVSDAFKIKWLTVLFAEVGKGMKFGEGIMTRGPSIESLRFLLIIW